MCLKCAHHSVWGHIVFTFIYYNRFPTSPLSVAKESTAVEKCVRQPWSWREAPHISKVILLMIHLIVDVKKCVRHFLVLYAPFVHEAPGHFNLILLDFSSFSLSLFHFQKLSAKLSISVIFLTLQKLSFSRGFRSLTRRGRAWHRLTLPFRPMVCLNLLWRLPGRVL